MTPGNDPTTGPAASFAPLLGGAAAPDAPAALGTPKTQEDPSSRIHAERRAQSRNARHSAEAGRRAERRELQRQERRDEGPREAREKPSELQPAPEQAESGLEDGSAPIRERFELPPQLRLGTSFRLLPEAGAEAALSEPTPEPPQQQGTELAPPPSAPTRNGSGAPLETPQAPLAALPLANAAQAGPAKGPRASTTTTAFPGALTEPLGPSPQELGLAGLEVGSDAPGDPLPELTQPQPPVRPGSVAAAAPAVPGPEPHAPAGDAARPGAGELSAVRPGVDPARGPDPAAAVRPTPPAAPAPTLADDHAAQILRQVRLSLSPELRQATLELEPASLGRLSIKVSLRRGRVTAELRAERPETLSVLERHVPELRAALAEHGLEADEFTLDLGFEQSNGDTNAGRESGRETARRGAPEGLRTAGIEAARARLAGRLRNELGVDTYA